MSIVEPIRNLVELKKIERILAQKSERDLLLFVIGTNCGLRISDILALNVGDVKDKTHIVITEQKTGKYKKFPINSKLKPIIQNYVKDKDEDDPLFMTVFKNRMYRVAAYDIIRNACEKANVQVNVGTHTLRKTFGYHHYKRFKDVAMLQKIFNHSNSAVTLRYIGIEQDEIDESYVNFVL